MLSPDLRRSEPRVQQGRKTSVPPRSTKYYGRHKDGLTRGSSMRGCHHDFTVGWKWRCTVYFAETRCSHETHRTIFGLDFLTTVRHLDSKGHRPSQPLRMSCVCGSICTTCRCSRGTREKHGHSTSHPGVSPRKHSAKHPTPFWDIAVTSR